MNQTNLDRLRPSRRTVLKRGAIASAAGLVGLTATTGDVAGQACDRVVDDDGSTGYTTIQDAIDDASSGETICVRAGAYAEEVTVDTGVTVVGENGPDGPDAAVVDGSVEVAADDVTVRQLKVAPSTTFVAGGLDPHGILVTGDLDGVTVEDNLVEGMTADSDGGSVTINGIQVWNDGPDHQTGTVVRGNTVRDMDNDGGTGGSNYGGAAAIKVQGVVEGTNVVGNTVEAVHSAGWTYGVVTTHTGNAPGTSPSNTTVEGNTLREINDGSIYDVFDDPEAAPYPGSAFAVDGNSDADEVRANGNNLLETPIGAQNKDESHTLDAECNYWGHASGPEEAENGNGRGTGVVGDVDYTPWNTRMIGRGEHPDNSCVGGENADTGRRP